MNFYPHHIGDYLTATAHLSWLEDCAYRRLLDIYYSREQVIPADVTQACRLVRALSKDERKAVEVVLNEFFARTDSGWSHARCELEINKAKVAAERARVNGKQGGRPVKAKPTSNPEITQSVSVANPEKTKSQAPITNPITNPSNTSPSVDVPHTAGEVCKAMKDAGMQSVNPSNQKLIALLEAGITLPEMVDAAKDATEKGKPFAYALAVAEGRRRDAATMPLPDATQTRAETTYQRSMRERVAEFAPDIARKAPGEQKLPQTPVEFFEVEALRITQ